jgi:hypothetical protein
MNILDLGMNEGLRAWDCSSGYKSHVDFLVWVLEIDGLHIPPFNQHPQGDQSLKSRRITADLWKSWMTQVLQYFYYDNVFSCRNSSVLQGNQNYQALLNQRALELAERQNIDQSAVEEKLTRYAARQQAEAEQLLEEAQQFYGGVMPPHLYPNNFPSIWTGESTLIDRLQELWAEFQSIYQQRRSQWDWLDLPQSINYQPELPPEAGERRDLWAQLKPYQAHLRTLKVYLVAYPYTVSYAQPPVSCLISVSPESQRRQLFYDQATQAAQKLVQLNQAQP